MINYANKKTKILFNKNLKKKKKNKKNKKKKKNLNKN